MLQQSAVKYKDLDKKTHVVAQDLNNALNGAIDAINGIKFTGSIFSSKYPPKNSDGENGDLWIQLQ
jgi:hypothetical protein